MSGNEADSGSIPFAVQMGISGLSVPGGIVVVADAAVHDITNALAGGVGVQYLTQIEAICTVAATAAGTFTLGGLVLGVQTTFLIFEQPIALAAIGTRYVWTFPTPIRQRGQNGNPFNIKHSAATIGTWAWSANGFYYTN